MERTQVTWHDVGRLDSLADGAPTAAFAGEVPVLLVRRGAEVAATDLLCPHKFTSLDEGTVEGGRLRCPRHEAAFDLETGAPPPGHEWAGTLPVHPCRVEDGRVLVQI